MTQEARSTWMWRDSLCPLELSCYPLLALKTMRMDRDSILMLVEKTLYLPSKLLHPQSRPLQAMCHLTEDMVLMSQQLELPRWCWSW